MANPRPTSKDRLIDLLLTRQEEVVALLAEARRENRRLRSLLRAAGVPIPKKR